VSDKLKPCPFCGGEASGSHREDAYCIDEKCAGWTLNRCSDEKWNTRADIPPTTKQIMADPRVKALVEAARRASHATEDNGCGKFYTAEAIALQAALAQLKEPK
jgi:hypothetical protein